MHYTHIAVPVALQRYREAPPVAVAQRDMARDLAQLYQAKITLISAAAPVSMLEGTESVDEKLTAFAAPLMTQGFDVDTALLLGRPRDVVPDFLEQAGCDVLVLGTHSKQTPAEVPLGNNAAALLAEVNTRVVLIRPSLEDIDGGKKLMLPEYPWEFAYA